MLCFIIESPAEIIFPDRDIVVRVNATDPDIQPITCEAIGYPEPNVYWARGPSMDFFTDSDVLEVNITVLTSYGGRVFFCIAENSLGRDVVKVTFNLVITIHQAQDRIEDIMDDVNDADSVSDALSGQRADQAKLVIDASNDNQDFKGEDKSQILEDSARIIDMIVEKMDGAFSDETANSIAGLLSSVVEGCSALDPESHPPNVSTQFTTINFL